MNFSLRNDDTNVSFGEDLTIMNSLCLNHPACFLPSKPNLWFKVQFNFHFLLLKRWDTSHLCSIALNHLWDTQQPANSWCTFISSLSLWDRGLHLAWIFMCAVCLWAETAAVCQTSTQPFELTAPPSAGASHSSLTSTRYCSFWICWLWVSLPSLHSHKFPQNHQHGKYVDSSRDLYGLQFPSINAGNTLNYLFSPSLKMARVPSDFQQAANQNENE